MDYRSQIQVELIKLKDGGRLMRLTYLATGLALEAKLDSTLAIVRQKERLFSLFEKLLAQAELTPA